MKKISDDIAHALDKCAEALSINELSRVTGVRIELLRRFITRKTRHVRGETWDRIYPVLRPYLASAEPPPDSRMRLGWWPPCCERQTLIERLTSPCRRVMTLRAIFEIVAATSDSGSS